MTITKDELHKLIDSAAQDLLEEEKCYRYGYLGEITYYTQAWMLKDILMDCQKPKELTLHEKLINAGFVMDNFNYYRKDKIILKIYQHQEILVLWIRRDGNNDNDNALTITDITNHAKVFEAIDFLTKWQS